MWWTLSNQQLPKLPHDIYWMYFSYDYATCKWYDNSFRVDQQKCNGII